MGVAPGVMEGVAPPIIGVAEGASPMGVSSQRDLCFLAAAPPAGVSPPAQPGVAPPSTCQCCTVTSSCKQAQNGPDSKAVELQAAGLRYDGTSGMLFQKPVCTLEQDAVRAICFG